MLDKRPLCKQSLCDRQSRNRPLENHSLRDCWLLFPCPCSLPNAQIRFATSPPSGTVPTLLRCGPPVPRSSVRAPHLRRLFPSAPVAALPNAVASSAGTDCCSPAYPPPATPCALLARQSL